MTEFGDNTERHYLAIIGDIRGSRTLPDRGAVQERLRDGLERVNREFQDELASPFIITLGDEFQALVGAAAVGVGVVVGLEEALRGIPLRYGLGWGTLETAFQPTTIGMDGPCLIRARESVARGKREVRWVTVSGFGEDDEIVNGIFAVMAAIRSDWTEIQAETVGAARAAATQRDVAAARGRSESTVSKALKAAHFDEIVEAENSVRAILARHDRPGDAPGRGER